MAEDLALSTVGDDASLKTSLTDMLDILRRNGIMYTLLGGLRRFDASPQENSTEAAQPEGIWGKKKQTLSRPLDASLSGHSTAMLTLVPILPVWVSFGKKFPSGRMQRAPHAGHPARLAYR